jgi:5-phospho-D-xylono-1,4-lactonase
MTASAPDPSILPPQITTVLGPVPAESIGLVDAHSHLWIDPVPGSAPGSPVLNRERAILAELSDFRALGGGAVVDCQPGGCGRNAVELMWLSRESGIHVIACTGFHRQRYYSPDFWLWSATAERAAGYFLDEIRVGLSETLKLPIPARAGILKIACEATLATTPAAALEGAAYAAVASDTALEIHTERGAAAEEILRYFLDRGVPAGRLVLCHVDKRPDLALHAELASAGALLEYDTFYRPQYRPEETAWPLIAAMLAAGYERSLALATDIAEAALWKHLGGGPGLPGLATLILPRLHSIGATPAQIELLLGKNILRSIARPAPTIHSPSGA